MGTTFAIHHDNIYEAAQQLEDDTGRPFIKDLFILGCNTGLRGSELLWLKRSDYCDGRLTTVRYKGGNAVTTVLNQDGIKAIERLIKWSEAKFPETDYIFTRKFRGEVKPITIHYLNRLFKRSIGANLTDDLDGIASGIMRKTFATALYRKGVPHDAISYALGHSDSKSIDYYIDLPLRDYDTFEIPDFTSEDSV